MVKPPKRMPLAEVLRVHEIARSDSEQTETSAVIFGSYESAGLRFIDSHIILMNVECLCAVYDYVMRDLMVLMQTIHRICTPTIAISWASVARREPVVVSAADAGAATSAIAYPTPPRGQGLHAGPVEGAAQPTHHHH